MSNRTNTYNFLYLEDGDIIFPAYDEANMETAENQFFGMYSYLGQGIINGWKIYWMGCTSDSYVMDLRQALLDAYRTDRFSYLALQYELLNYPRTEADWGQCVAVSTGLGIIDVFHAATEQPVLFRYTQSGLYYVWAQKSVCTNTEYLCDIVSPSPPDEDYDLHNPAIYIGEVNVTTVVTQISYSQRRRELKNAQGDIQRMLQQALVNHVHSGEGAMPPKVNLNTQLTINVPVVENSNTFIFTYPTGFVLSKYNKVPQVFVNGILLLPSQYQIEGTILYLQNSVQASSVIQIVYKLAPGPNISITSDYTQSPLGSTGGVPLAFVPTDGVYYLVDGTTTTLDDGSTILNIFKWNAGDYSEIDVYLDNALLDKDTYILNNTQGTFQIIGPVIASISNYTESQIYIKFVTPSFEVKGLLPSSKIKSISASSFKSGTLSPYRLTGLDHLGFIRENEPAKLIPYKKLLDSGNHIVFYPEIDSPIQHSDYIYYAKQVQNIKVNKTETETLPRTVISTANGLFITQSSPLDYSHISALPWNVDTGIANEFSENYYGNFAVIRPQGVSAAILNSINPKVFWVLSRAKNQFRNVLYLSNDYGQNYQNISIPITSSNVYVTINDFIFTLDVVVAKVGSVVVTPTIQVYYQYYLGATDGLYSSRLTRNQNQTKPIWSSPAKSTTDYATGSVNAISEAVNIAINTTKVSLTGATETNYITSRRLYAACDNGFFIYTSGTGTKFATSSSLYNTDSSAFNFVKWLGLDDGSSNTPQNIVWADGSGIYYTASAQKYTVQSNDNYGTSTTETYDQPLTLSGTAYTVKAASTSELDLTQQITTIDGYTLNNNDKILIKNQSDLTENNIYIWSSTTLRLSNLNVAGPLNVLVQNGSTQSETVWIDLYTDPSLTNPVTNIKARNFGLWFTRLISLSSGDHVVSVVKDKSSGPGSNSLAGDTPGSYTQGTQYANSFFVATTSHIYRVLNVYNSPFLYPVIITIPWDTSQYGIITSIQHYASNEDLENGVLTVFTENGIYKSAPEVFSKSTLSYVRFINTISPESAGQASVYNGFSLEEISGKITSIGYGTSTTSVADGQYLNLPVKTNSVTGSGLTVDLSVSSGLITKLEINNPGSNYQNDISQASLFVGNSKIILQNLVTEGVFTASGDTQAFTYSKSSGFSPSLLLYESDYRTFYIKPWSNFPYITIKINDKYVSKTFTYDSSLGQIVFTTPVTKQQKNAITVSLVNIGQYISNTGVTPHAEVFNIIATDAAPAGKLTATYDPLSSKSSILSLDRFDNTKWNNRVNTIKVIGQRAATSNSTILSPYTEIVQVTVDVTSQKVFVKFKPTTLPLTSGSKIYIARNVSSTLGIEDKITLSRSKLTYHMDSVSHLNVYNLANTLTEKIPNLFAYPTIPNETLTGINRGLQNTIAIKSLSGFDPKATFIGYNFGVEPSAVDVAASPSVISLILSFTYGGNPVFATDKGLWTYARSTSSWVKTDSIDNSEIVYFANKSLTNSQNKTQTYAGTNKGLYIINGGTYTADPLFDTPVLSINMGAWYSTTTGIKSRRFEAYGKDSGLSFVLRTITTSGVSKLQSDYFDNHVIYDIYYNTFFRYDDKGNKTEHPAIYLATDSSVWAFTTDALTGSPSDRGANHTLLVGRQIFGSNLIRNKNKIDPSLPGLPAKIYKIVELAPPQGSKVTWLAVATSNGVYTVINWKQCDVGDPNGLVFYPQNIYSTNNKTVGREVFVLIPSTSDTTNSTYFAGTDAGVYRSKDRCYSFVKTASFNNQDLSINDLSYLVNAGVSYLIASTNLGLWVSTNDGDSWTSIKDVSDVNIKIASNPTYGVPLSQAPEQVFSSLTTGTISKAFIYFDPSNLTGETLISAKIKIGSLTTQSASSITLNADSYPGMYGFAFTSTPILANTNYSLGIVTDSTSYSGEVTWNIANSDNPYSSGYAKTSGGTLTDKDFFFRISLETIATPTEIIEPVGFYNTSYSIGFASGYFSGASISSTGMLYSNVGILCNVVLDISKSFEINDQGVITIAGLSTSYLKQAVINSLVPNGVGTDNLYTRLLNGFGTSKFLSSIYGYNSSINDLVFNTTSSGDTNSCLSVSQNSYQGYTNIPSILQSSVQNTANTGRLSKLYDAMLFNSRLQFPEVIRGFYSDNFTEVDTNFVNIQAVSSEYSSTFLNFVTLNLTLISGNNYSITYGDSINRFMWTSGSYAFGMVKYSDGTYELITPDSYTNGIYINTNVLTPTVMYLSKDWDFDVSLGILSQSYNIWSESPEAVQLALNQYAKSFKPLIILTTDGNDNSMATPADVGNSLEVAWTGNGTQVLVIEPSHSGNENHLLSMLGNTNSKFFSYDSYPETAIKSILYGNDDLDLFTSTWNREYDFLESKFISYIYASYVTPGLSTVSVKFKWSKDKINYSDFIELPNNSRYYLNQKVSSIYYEINFRESYASGARVLPYVSKLYHAVVIPSTQTYLTYPQAVDGQIFETLASASFTNNTLVEISPIVGRTDTIDTSYYESVQLNRNTCLPNRQTSYRITQAFTESGLKLFPSSTNSDGTYNYLQFYVVNNSGLVQTWTSSDTFILSPGDGLNISPSAYTTIPESGIIAFQTQQGTVLPSGLKQYETFTAQIQYAERRENVQGEPTTTFDYKTYYFANGRVPQDATVVVLVNQKIYRGTYNLSPYDGSVTFARALNAEDYVTVFIKFASTFRTGLQINSYGLDNLSLQSFNFTYTALQNLATYQNSLNYSKPFIQGTPILSPSVAKINDGLSLSYNYVDSNSTPEKNSLITWWRKRTGIEYITFNTAVNLAVSNFSGTTFVGLHTFVLQSYYNPENSFLIYVTTNTVVNTNIVDAVIADRGSNFIGTSTSLIGIVTQNGVMISNFGVAVTAYTLAPSYKPGYSTTDLYVRINPSSPIGYSTALNGSTITAFPNYDNRNTERLSDIGARTLFDGRDHIYAVVSPNNGFTTGNKYQSNIVLMDYAYTPSASNLSILNAKQSFNGINTELTISSSVNQIGIYSYSSGLPGSPYLNQDSTLLNQNIITWYKLTQTGISSISHLGILSSSLIEISDQIYFSLYPGVINSDGTIGYGNTVSSDVFTAIE